MKNKILKKKKGFTLIEVLLGLLIFSIISLGLYNTFRTGILLDRRGSGLTQLFQQVRWALEQLTEELEGARYYDFSGSYEDKTSFFGDQSKMTFFIAEDDGLKVIEYSLAEPDFGKIVKTVIGKKVKKLKSLTLSYSEKNNVRFLIRKELSFAESLQEDSKSEGEKEVLITKVAEGGLSFKFGEIDKNEFSQELVWHDEWEGPYVPSAVRVELALLHPDKKSENIRLTRDIIIPIGGVNEKDEEKKQKNTGF